MRSCPGSSIRNLDFDLFYSFRHPKTLNFENRSNSAPNVCVNSVLKPLVGGDQKILANAKCPVPLQTYCEHSHSTQASPTNTLKHVKRRQRARSADESNKILSPREQIQTGEDWNIDASEILMGPRIGSGSFGTVYKGEEAGFVGSKANRVFFQLTGTGRSLSRPST